jgi:hypothetical protein
MIVLVLLTPFFMLHASHVYLTVLTLSSGSDDRLRWPRESPLNWISDGFLAFGVLMVWSILNSIPAGVISEVSPQWGLASWLALMWLIVPFSLFSVITAPSRLLFLYPPLIARLLRQWRALLFVHFITIQLFLFVLIGFWLMLAKANALGIVVVAVVLPPALMVHARAWGRLAWLAVNCDLPAARTKRKRKPIHEEAPLEVELESIDDGADDYALQPVRAAVCERLVTMTEICDQKLEFERQRRERFGEPDPLDGPVAPTFESALGQHAFHFLFEADTLAEWVRFGLTCLIMMTTVFLTAILF